jgi:hypothetical protein
MFLDTASLLVMLDTYSVPSSLLNQLPELPAETKDEAVIRIAAVPAQASAQVLARLPLIRTPRNEPDIAAVLRAGLRSPDADSRKFALYGLQDIGAPDVRVAALTALDDYDDRVVATAATILLPDAADAEIERALRRAYAAHAGDDTFHVSTSLLEARLIEPGEPA